jgi:hypothetical protein
MLLLLGKANNVNIVLNEHTFTKTFEYYIVAN